MFLVQWNCNGIQSHSSEIKLLTSKLSPTILSIQESHLRPHHAYSLRGYKCYRFDFLGGESACGGTTLLIKNNTASKEFHLTNTNIQANAVTIKIADFYHTPITICSIYIPPHQNISVDELTQLFQQLPPPYIVTGDFNAHNPLWGSTTTNNRGNVINKFLSEFDTVLLNTGQPTHINISNGNLSSIDLTFSSPSIAHLLQWQTQDDLYFSDHFPIMVSLQNRNQALQINKIPTWIISKANWKKFQQDFSFTTPQSNDTDSVVNSFTNAVLSAAQNSIPKSADKISPRYVPWWCPEIKKAITLRKKSLRNFKKRPTQENLIHFKKQRALARRLILLKKRESWKQFVNSITQNTSVKEMWQKIRILKGNYVPKIIPFVSQNNAVYTSPEDIANCLANHFASVSATSSYSHTFQTIKTQIETHHLSFESQNNEIYNQLFSYSELTLCITNYIKNTAPGPDDIHPFMIKNLPEQGLIQMLNIYNHIWSSHQFPSTWSQAIIVPILKPNKESHSPTNYRPISLTCVLCKILEKMVSKRLLWFIETNNLLSSYQSGFRKKRSTSDHLLDLQQDILTAFHGGNKLYSIFFDMEKAYDKAWRYKILQKIQSLGIRGHLAFFIKNFLSNRSFRVRVNHTFSSLKPIENGVPQGSVLSTTLFILLIDEISTIITPPISLRLFADDINISIKCKHPQIAQRILQPTLHKLQTWAENNGFTFSESKTKCVCFSRKKKILNHPLLTLKEKPLQFQDTLKFLGLIFDSRLTWKPHILYLKNEIATKLNILKVINHPTYNPSRKLLLNLYRSLIRSKAEYGILALASASPNTLSILNPPLNVALRICIGALRSTPIQSLYCEASELPPTYRRRVLANNYLSKISNNRNHPIMKRIEKHVSSLALPIFEPISTFLETSREHHLPIPNNFEEQTPKPWNTIQQKIDLSLASYPKSNTQPEIFKILFLELLSKYPNSTLCFTDGSKLPGHVGYAFTIGQESSNFKIHPASSVYTAELTAILHSLMKIKNLPANTLPINFLIFSDSLSALTALQNASSPHPVIHKILDVTHDLLASQKIITFIFVPSHTGIEGNELVDRLAKDATTTSPLLSIVPQDSRALFYQLANSTWQSEWSQSCTKLSFHKKTISRWKHLSSLNRKEEIAITRIRLGHTRLTHQHLFAGIRETPICPFCQTLPLTVTHILHQCTTFSAIRITLNIKNDPTPISDDFQAIQTILEFLRRTKLFTLI